MQHDLSGERFSNAADVRKQIDQWIKKMIPFLDDICQKDKKAVENDGKYFD